MNVGDLVRYHDPIKGTPKWIGIIIAVERSGNMLWRRVHWQDGLERWEHSYNLERVNEGG